MGILCDPLKRAKEYFITNLEKCLEKLLGTLLAISLSLSILVVFSVFTLFSKLFLINTALILSVLRGELQLSNPISICEVSYSSLTLSVSALAPNGQHEHLRPSIFFSQTCNTASDF